MSGTDGLLEALDTSVPQASILLLADHGEGLHQHGEPNHGKTWREQIHVPCMMRIPGHDRRRVSEVVSVVDVLPTWLAALGFEGGERFLARARGRDALAPGFVSTPVLSQDSENPNKGSLYRTSLTVDRWKYFLVRTGEDGYSEELYNLQEDPFERNDLAAEAQGEARRVLLDLREELLEQIRSQQARGLQLDSAENRPALDPDRIEELQSLGYTQ